MDNQNSYGGIPGKNPYETPPYPLRSSYLKQLSRQALSGHYGTMIGISLLLAVFSIAISYTFSFMGNQLFLLCSIAFETNSVFLRYGLTFVLNFMGSLLSCLFTVGSAHAYVQLLYGQPVHVSMLFDGFRTHPDRIILSNIPLILITLVLSIPANIYSEMYLDFAQEYMEAMGSLGTSGSLETLPVMSNSMLLMALLATAASIALLFAVLPFAMMDYLLAEMEKVSPKDIIRTSFAMMKGHKMRYLGLILSFLGWILLGVVTCGIAFLWVMPYMETTQAAFYLDAKRLYLQKRS
jgi:uncharacterized membrane protein